MTMLRSIRRIWRYLGTKLGVWHDEHADPKVQLEQATEEARAQHRRLLDQAATVIAHQRQSQQRLDRTVNEYESVTALARQALLLADQATRQGDADKAASFTAAAEGYAAQLLAVERQLAEHQQVVIDTTRAADGAKAAVAQNADALREMLERRERMLSDLERAKMQETANRAEEQISSTLGADVPTVAEVATKIQTRLARAQGRAELLAVRGNPIDPATIEIERAQRTAAAHARLDAMRDQLGLSAPQGAIAPSAVVLPLEAERKRG
jgi:phage shock protein A